MACSAVGLRAGASDKTVKYIVLYLASEGPGSSPSERQEARLQNHPTGVYVYVYFTQPIEGRIRVFRRDRLNRGFSGELPSAEAERRCGTAARDETYDWRRSGSCDHEHRSCWSSTYVFRPWKPLGELADNVG